MIWILVLMTYKGGVAMQEFNSEPACWTARAAAVRSYEETFGRGAGPIASVCVKKG